MYAYLYKNIYDIFRNILTGDDVQNVLSKFFLVVNKDPERYTK